MNNYFRITGYCPEHNVCFIADSYGKFNELYDFSSYLIEKGIKVITARAEGRFEFGNIPKALQDNENILLRACAKGQPNYTDGKVNINGKIYTPKP